MSDSCLTCFYWADDAPPLATEGRLREGTAPIGICQRFPPRLAQAGSDWISVFPQIHADRTCGEWLPGTAPDGGGEEAQLDNVIPIERAIA